MGCTEEGFVVEVGCGEGGRGGSGVRGLPGVVGGQVH